MAVDTSILNIRQALLRKRQNRFALTRIIRDSQGSKLVAAKILQPQKIDLRGTARERDSG
ncbi:hypothetical protein D3C83_292770 [compost metagenome]